MRVTATERREVLKLFNVCEVARQLGVSVQRLYRDIRAERIEQPSKCIAKRRYYTPDDVTRLTTHYRNEGKIS